MMDNNIKIIQIYLYRYEKTNIKDKRLIWEDIVFILLRK